MNKFSLQFFHCLLLITLIALAKEATSAQTITSGAVYRLRNQCSQKVLDVSGVSTANGALVHQWTDVNGLNQRWRVESTDSGFYRLLAQHSNKALDVSEARTADGTAVLQWDYVNAPEQQWQITSTGNGFFKLSPRHASNKALDVNGASTANGAKVQIWTDNGTCAQRWQLELVSGTVTPQPPPNAPINPNASRQARNVLGYLYQISGNQILSGQQNWNNSDYFTDRVSQITGRYPALWGNDLWMDEAMRPVTTGYARAYWDNGGLVTLSWHACQPDDEEPCDWGGSVQSPLSDAQWNELLTPGTNLNNRWRAQTDRMAAYLKQLRDANVPVLWRPYHEMNGGWFWWGGNSTGTPERFKTLWRMLYDRLTNVHGLNNLLWVWAPGAVDNAAAYFPGINEVDVVGYDVYWGDFQNRWHSDLLTIGGGKPIALTEVGDMPLPNVLESQTRWTSFLTWADLLEGQNTHDEIRSVYNHPRVITRDEVPNLK